MRRLSGGLLASTLLHAALYGAALGLIAWNEAHTAYRTDIDQTNAPLLALDQRKPPPPPKPWVLARKEKKAPKPVTPTPSPTPEPVAAPVVATRQPSWISGFITEDDYPEEMRQEKKEGRVVAEVLIDIAGNVKSVKIVQGSEPAFNEVVLEKLQAARFRPALDKQGQPINCRVLIPISFKLD